MQPSISVEFLFFLIDSLKYLDIVLSEIEDMLETAVSVRFSSTLKETTLSEQGVFLKYPI